MVRKGMVCEVRSDVRVHPSSSHSVGRCGSGRCLHHRCAQGGPFPSIIHLNRRPIGALVSILPPLPPFPPSFTFPLSCPPPFLSLPPSSPPRLVFMGFRNPGVSIYHPLRSSLDGNSLQRTHARWAIERSPRGEGFPLPLYSGPALIGLFHGA